MCPGTSPFFFPETCAPLTRLESIEGHDKAAITRVLVKPLFEMLRGKSATTPKAVADLR